MWGPAAAFFLTRRTRFTCPGRLARAAGRRARTAGVTRAGAAAGGRVDEHGVTPWLASAARTSAMAGSTSKRGEHGLHGRIDEQARAPWLGRRASATRTGAMAGLTSKHGAPWPWPASTARTSAVFATCFNQLHFLLQPAPKCATTGDPNCYKPEEDFCYNGGHRNSTCLIGPATPELQPVEAFSIAVCSFRQR